MNLVLLQQKYYKTVCKWIEIKDLLALHKKWIIYLELFKVNLKKVSCFLLNCSNVPKQPVSESFTFCSVWETFFNSQVRPESHAKNMRNMNCWVDNNFFQHKNSMVWEQFNLNQITAFCLQDKLLFYFHQNDHSIYWSYNFHATYLRCFCSLLL